MKHVVTVLAIVLLTWVPGWYGVAIAAFGVAWGAHREGAITFKIAVDAAIAWTLLLLFDGLRGPLRLTASTLVEILRIPGPALLIVTVLFAALLAWSAAAFARELRSVVRPSA